MKFFRNTEEQKDIEPQSKSAEKKHRTAVRAAERHRVKFS